MIVKQEVSQLEMAEQYIQGMFAVLQLIHSPPFCSSGLYLFPA